MEILEYFGNLSFLPADMTAVLDINGAVNISPNSEVEIADVTPSKIYNMTRDPEQMARMQATWAMIVLEIKQKQVSPLPHAAWWRDTSHCEGPRTWKPVFMLRFTNFPEWVGWWGKNPMQRGGYSETGGVSKLYTFLRAEIEAWVELKYNTRLRLVKVDPRRQDTVVRRAALQKSLPLYRQKKFLLDYPRGVTDENYIAMLRKKLAMRLRVFKLKRAPSAYALPELVGALRKAGVLTELVVLNNVPYKLYSVRPCQSEVPGVDLDKKDVLRVLYQKLDPYSNGAFYRQIYANHVSAGTADVPATFDNWIVRVGEAPSMLSIKLFLNRDMTVTPFGGKFESVDTVETGIDEMSIKQLPKFDVDAQFEKLPSDFFDVAFEFETHVDGSRDDAAAELHDALGITATVWSSYHGDTKRPNRWYVEPDGSVENHGVGNEKSAEFSTNRMNSKDAVELVPKFMGMVKSSDILRTSDVCGVHVNISLTSKAIRHLRTEGDIRDSSTGDAEPGSRTVDWKKVMAMTGEYHWGRMTNRLRNSYAVLQEPKLARDRGGSDLGCDKYQSLYPRGRTYGEWRIFGGEKYEEKPKELAQLVKRACVALYAGASKSLLKDQYALRKALWAAGGAHVPAQPYAGILSILKKSFASLSDESMRFYFGHWVSREWLANEIVKSPDLLDAWAQAISNESGVIAAMAEKARVARLLRWAQKRHAGTHPMLALTKLIAALEGASP
jgi:hypothetical protein